MTYFYSGGGRLVIQDRITWRITCIYVGFSATQDATLLLTMSSSRTWIFENTRRSRLRFDGSDRRRKNTVPDSTLKKRTRVQGGFNVIEVHGVLGVPGAQDQMFKAVVSEDGGA